MAMRVLFNLVLLTLAFCATWWVVLILVAVGVFIFPFYGEALLFGIIIDLLYGTAVSFGFGAVGFVLTFIIFMVMIRVKYAVRPAYN